jgi:hypothetical protein
VDTPSGGQKKRKKLDVRSIRGIFIGYATHQKGWKILDCSTGTILTTCHVTFDETGSPASEELKRQELTKLAKFIQLDFDYYSSTATADVDFLILQWSNS